VFLIILQQLFEVFSSLRHGIIIMMLAPGGGAHNNVRPLTMLINHFIHMMLRSFDFVAHGCIFSTSRSHP
jgi:hypothetical protein